MKKQNQWLFEASPASELTSYFNQEYYSNPELETEWELQGASPYALGEEEWESLSSSPRGQTSRETVSGFSRYSNAIPSQERAKIARIAQMIVQSHRSGQPIRTVRLVGHADRDVQRGASFEKKISGDRALRIQGTLAEAIERFSNSKEEVYRWWPPISTRINWQRFAAGATQVLVQNPSHEIERLRNRRVEIELYPARSPFAKPSFVRASSFGLVTQTVLNSNIEKTISEFCQRIGSQEINRDNCFVAVEKVISVLAVKAPRTGSGAVNYAGYQLVEKKDYNAPVSKTMKCCHWQSNSFQLCTTKPAYADVCVHCSGTNGQYLILKYKPLLNQVVKNLKCTLDKGWVVKAGVLSGICDDKPDIGCAKRTNNKSLVWRDCPEHWILIIGYDGDTFVFWDSSRASSISRCGHEFGLLHFNATENRLSTAPVSGNPDPMAVNSSGFHVSDNAQKRFQVLTLLTGGPFRAPTGKC